MARTKSFAAIAAALVLVAGCKTAQQDEAGTTGDTTTTADDSGATMDDGSGMTTDDGSGTTTGGGTSIPALVNVNLRNVLNNLSVAISVEEANIPVNAQVPIEVAANVCGVSVTALAASIASGQAGCTATTTSPELIQVVQQQISAGGDVGGGDQTTTPPDTNLM